MRAYKKPNTSPAIKANSTLEASRCTKANTSAEPTTAKPVPCFRRAENSTPRKANSSITGTSTAVEQNSSAREGQVLSPPSTEELGW